MQKKHIPGIRYMSPSDIRSSHEEVQKFYNEEIASPVVESGYAYSLIEKFVKDKSSKILEVSPGTGMLANQLKHGGYTNLYGVDIDNYLRENPMKELKILDVSFEKLPWPDDFFDTVISFETMEHLENPYHFIREAHRVLKPEGQMIISMPNVQHIFNKIFFFRKGDMPRWRKNNGHLWVTPKGVFQKAFLNYFDQIENGYYWGFFPWRFLAKFSFWPENERFAHTAWWLFKKKDI